jgi:hypothetical protein
MSYIQGQRETVTSLHWPIQDLRTERRGGLPTRVTGAIVRRAPHVPYIIVEEVFEGTRGAVTTGGTGCAGGFDLYGAPNQNTGYSGENYPEQEDTDV